MAGVGDRPAANLFSLAGKTAVVTGATGYLGTAFVEALLEAGAAVVLVGRGDKLEAEARRLRAEHGEARVHAADADCFETEVFRRVLSEAIDRRPSVDVLVNNAYRFGRETGFNDPSGHLEAMSKDQWMQSLEAGIYWHALATQVVIPRMSKQGSGSIINVSSMYGLVSPDPALYEGVETFNPPSYGAAKAGLLALTRYTASFYGRYGVRCNALAPGAFPNAGGNSYNAPRNDMVLQRLRERTVLGRYGEPGDLKGPLVFLASDASRYVTGQCLVVDGGWTIR